MGGYGVFASSSINPAVRGLIEGNVSFFFKETISVLGAAAYAFVFTYLMLALINKITPVKVSSEVEEKGIDIALHGEKAYDEGSL